MALLPYPVKNGAYGVQDGYVKSSLDMHLDMTDTDDHIDLSSHSLTTGEGMTFLVWVRPYRVGSSSTAHGPAIHGGEAGGYDDFFELYNDEQSGASTSGTVTTRFACESASGSWLNTNTFSIDLDNNPWYLMGYTSHTDGTYTFWIDDTSVSPNSNNTSSGSIWNINYYGYGYNDANGGSGGKDMDAPGIWNRELTSTEISDYANNGIVPDTPANIWYFDDDTDTSTAVDSAGSADGTINGATYVDGSAY